MLGEIGIKLHSIVSPDHPNMRECSAFGHEAMIKIVQRGSRELEVLRMISHPNLISTIGIYECGTLSGVLQEKHTPIMLGRVKEDPDDYMVWSSQLISAITHLHILGFIHCDIKAENILLTNNDVILTDMGSVVGCDASGRPRSRGPPSYTMTNAPIELLRGEEWDWKIDSWSLGCSLFEIAYGRRLFPPQKNNTRKRYYNAICSWGFYRSRDFDCGEKFANIDYINPKIPSGLGVSKLSINRLIVTLLEPLREYRPAILSLTV